MALTFINYNPNCRMKFYVYKGKGKKQLWRWRLVARNRKVLADSGESYTRRVDCLKSLLRVKGHCFNAKVIFL